MPGWILQKEDLSRGGGLARLQPIKDGLSIAIAKSSGKNTILMHYSKCVHTVQVSTERKQKMRRESYLEKPLDIEVYPVDGGTDIIIRKNIEEVEKEEIQDEKTYRYNVWACDETQLRYKGDITEAEVREKLDYIIGLAEGTEKEPTQEERICALEITTDDLVLMMADLIGEEN